MSNQKIYDQLSQACESGNLTKVKDLLNIHKIQFNPYEENIILKCMIDCMNTNQLDILRYLYNNPELHTSKDNKQLIKEDLALLDRACLLGNTDFIEYIVQNPQFNNHLNENKEYIYNIVLTECLMSGFPELVPYFIMNFNLERNESIENILENITDPEKSQIEKFFQSRDLHNSLNEELNHFGNLNLKIKKTKM